MGTSGLLRRLNAAVTRVVHLRMDVEILVLLRKLDVTQAMAADGTLRT